MANTNPPAKSNNPTARTNFIPIIAFKYHNAMYDKQYMDFLRAKYLLPLKEITEYTIFTIDHATAYRPDYISNQVYGITDFWWIVCFYNKVIHPLRDLYPSRVVKMPVYSQLTKMFQKMNAKETSVGSFVRL